MEGIDSGQEFRRHVIELVGREIPKMTVHEWLDRVERSRPQTDVDLRTVEVLHEARQEESPGD